MCMDKSTILAVQRTKLAIIRTLLVYVILSMLCLTAGFLLCRLSYGDIKGDAITMFVFSGVFFSIGIFIYYLSICRIKKIIGGDIVQVDEQKVKINTNI